MEMSLREKMDDKLHRRSVHFKSDPDRDAEIDFEIPRYPKLQVRGKR